MNKTWMIGCASALLFACAHGGAQSSGRPDMTGAKERGMANCPSAVPGSSTRAEKLPDGVDVFVTASDPTQIAAIRDRAHRQTVVAHHPGNKPHTGKGGDTGEIGYCPIVLVDSDVSATDLSDGARITVKPKDKTKVDSLQKLTEERIEALRSKGP